MEAKVTMVMELHAGANAEEVADRVAGCVLLESEAETLLVLRDAIIQFESERSPNEVLADFEEEGFDIEEDFSSIQAEYR